MTDSISIRRAVSETSPPVRCRSPGRNRPIELVDGEDHVLPPHQTANGQVAVGLALGARIESMSRIATSAVEAATAMLRVYCSWPGASAGSPACGWQHQVAVGHVDGDALLALGLRPSVTRAVVDLAQGDGRAGAAG